jgi:Amidohydrolase
MQALEVLGGRSKQRIAGKETTMSNSVKCIDSDAHVIEPRDMFERYLEPKYRGGLRDSDIPGLKMHPAEYFKRQCFISADQDDPGIKQVIDYLRDDSIVTATDFGHPEGRRYEVAVQEILELPDVPLESKKKMMWDNALRLYSIRP